MPQESFRIQRVDWRVEINDSLQVEMDKNKLLKHENIVRFIITISDIIIDILVIADFNIADIISNIVSFSNISIYADISISDIISNILVIADITIAI